MPILDALKELYVAMGGNASDVENLMVTPEIIEALSSLASTVVGSIPKITSGTTELTPGTSTLETGAVYLQYEV